MKAWSADLAYLERRVLMFDARRSGVAILLLACLSMIAAAGVAAASGEPSEEEPYFSTQIQMAVFRGELIPMDDVWGVAEACFVWVEALSRPECFDSEEEMDRRMKEIEFALANMNDVVDLEHLGGVTSASYCSGSLRLYDGLGYSGQSLSLVTRGKWLNLATYGFDQKTSSFKIGPCSAYFADWANGQGDWYPTNLTQAYDSSTSMISGWNNDVSSIYIA